jgi:hypothetical protein
MNRTLALALTREYELALSRARIPLGAPIIEFVVQKKHPIPLQIHKNKQHEHFEYFEIPEQIRRKGSNWKQAHFIMGVTPPRGIEVLLTLVKDRWDNGTLEYGCVLPAHEQATSFAEENKRYICVRVPQKAGGAHNQESLIDMHGAVNQAFMPHISMTLTTNGLPEALLDRTAETVRARIISNGREAFIRIESMTRKPSSRTGTIVR